MGVSVCTVGTNVCGYELQQSSAVDCQWTVASDYDLITSCFKDDGTWRLIWAMVPVSLCSTESVSCVIAVKWKKNSTMRWSLYFTKFNSMSFLHILAVTIDVCGFYYCNFISTLGFIQEIVFCYEI